MMIDLLESRTQTSILAAFMMKAAGAKNVDVPEPAKVRQELDDWLASAPPKSALASRDEAVLKAALFPQGSPIGQ